MEKKYYTPDFLEFRPGFIYEMLYRKQWIGNVAWTNQSNIAIKLDKMSHGGPETIRIKVLDKEDFESEGLEYSELFGYTNKTICFLPHNDVSGKLKYEICLWEAPKIIKFYGEIKNRSELQIILKMIN